MVQNNPFGKTYSVFNPGPQTLPAVGPGNRTGLPKSIRKKKRKKKKRKNKDYAVEQYLDFFTE